MMVTRARQPEGDVKRLLHRAEQAIAIEKASARDQRLAPFEPGVDVDMGEGLDDGGVDRARS